MTLDLHHEYLEQHPTDFQYSAFCDRYRDFLKRRGLSMRQQHLAGDKVFVDYSGKKPSIVNPKTGEVHEVKLFIALGVRERVSSSYSSEGYRSDGAMRGGHWLVLGLLYVGVADLACWAVGIGPLQPGDPGWAWRRVIGLLCVVAAVVLALSRATTRPRRSALVSSKALASVVLLGYGLTEFVAVPRAALATAAVRRCFEDVRTRAEVPSSCPEADAWGGTMQILTVETGFVVKSRGRDGQDGGSGSDVDVCIAARRCSEGLAHWCASDENLFTCP